MVTGGSGFVGSYVVKELLRHGHTPVCLVRQARRLLDKVPLTDQSRIQTVPGTLARPDAVRRAVEGTDAVIHLVGIINETPRHSFRRVHIDGTRVVVDAAKAAGVRRFVHMSALGARPDAVSRYHLTKYEAEQVVRAGGLDWTVFRPSVIHGPESEFMQLVKVLARPKLRYGPIPAMPYFGRGEGKLQPVSVRDVAHCMAASIHMPETIGQTYSMGGPEVYDWKQLYALCSQAISGKTRRQVSVPVPLAKLVAVTVMKTPLVPKLLKFNLSQIQMSQEDSVCDTTPIEDTFNIELGGFKDAVISYADRIP